MLIPLSCISSFRFSCPCLITGGLRIHRQKYYAYLVVQDTKDSESGPICRPLTLILLNCQVLLTDGLSHLWHGVPGLASSGMKEKLQQLAP